MKLRSFSHLTNVVLIGEVRAARAARRFPGILHALEDGRLHLSAVVVLAPYLRKENGEDLVASASHKTRFEVERLVAERFPRPDLPPQAREVSPCSQALTWGALAPGPVGPGEGAESTGTHGEAPLVSERVPDRRSELAATQRPRPVARPSEDPRHIPASVKRDVWERDGGKCTFVSDTGMRCSSRRLIEFDHVTEVARGGTATTSGERHDPSDAVGAAQLRAPAESAPPRPEPPTSLRPPSRAAP